MSNTPYFVQKANSGLPAGQLSSGVVNLTGQGAGNMNLVSISYANFSSTTISVTVTSVTSSNGNTYSRSSAISKFTVSPAQGTSANSIQSFYAPTIHAGNETVTVNLSGPADALVVTVAEYSLPSATPFRSAGVTPTAAGTGNNPSATPISVSAASSWKGDLIIGIGVSWDGPVTIGAGYTSRETIRATYLEDCQSDLGGTDTASATAPSQLGAIGQTLSFATPVSSPPVVFFVKGANSGAPPPSSSSLQVALTGQGAGHMNFVAICFGNGSGNTIAATVTSVNSSAGNNYVRCTTPSAWVYGALTSSVQSFYAPNINGLDDTVTVNLSAAANFFWVGLYEYIVPGGSPLGSVGQTPDHDFSATGAGNISPVIVSGAVAYTNDLVIGIGTCNDGLSSAGSGFTLRDSLGSAYVEDQINSRTHVTTASANSNSSKGCIGQTIVFRMPSSIIPQNPTDGEGLLVADISASYATATNLADGNSWTWWSSGPFSQWAQWDAIVPVKVTRIRFSVIAGGEDLAIGSTFKGSNDPTFGSGVKTLYTVTGRSRIGSLMNEVMINSSVAYRYYRWTTVEYACICDLDIYVNSASASGALLSPGDVIMAPSTGNYDLPTYVTLKLLNGCPIYYTLNGATPTTNDHLYTGPVLISNSCVLSAAGIYGGNSGRTLARPFHIGKTEVSVDDIYHAGDYKLWALNGHVIYDPVSGYWYRYGISGDSPQYYGYGYCGNTCYRSADLRNWEYRSMVLPPAAGTADTNANIRYHVGIHFGFNPNTSKYVCWADSYDIYPNGNVWSAGKTVWTSNSPEGGFSLVRNFTSFPAGATGTTSGQACQGDSFLFVDNDGVNAYFYTTCGDKDGDINNTLFCAHLTSDWLDFASTAQYWWNSFSGGQQEAPCMIHVGNTYFLMYSPTVGFSTGACKYSTSSNPLGPFTGDKFPFQPAPAGGPDYNTSYDTQVWYILTVPGRQNGYIYHGDRYDCPSGTGFANVVMSNWKRIRLPVVFSGATMTINWFDAWSFDEKMPTVSGAPAAPSNVFIFSDGTGYWTNNELLAVQYYVDSADNSTFTKNVASVMVPLGQTYISGLPSATVYRVRAVNANGTSFSPIAIPDQPPLGLISINPPFLPVSFPPGPPTIPKWEDGPEKFVPYNGSMQMSRINAKIPIPGTGIRPGWEDGPGAADPMLSNINNLGGLQPRQTFSEHTESVAVAVAAEPVPEPKPIVRGTTYGELSPGGMWWWNGGGLPDDDWAPVTT
jgi:Chitobiase/beta-hexosaminidase C-terminal domain/Glycosyl hydrolases family 43